MTFPSGANIGDKHTEGAVNYEWTGRGWKVADAAGAASI